MKRYNILNNSLGWLCFVVAASTYILTLEPTASFWDCPEFITQGYKLEIGHPPGNPIFMLTARFFTNFAAGDITQVAWWVNCMSGLLSAGTILLLFWTITHLVKRLTVKDDATEISPLKMLVIFGSGICGALMYAWSDTFWFSAVEGEVYAFSSFCTALVFWLILKWESRADQPHSDKYLILIAYVIGISIAVHLLNLLCIPAIVLVIYYRRWKNTTGTGSCIALLISFVIVALILYGLVPGFIEISQYFEVFCVNTLGMSFNMGVLIYAIILVAALSWTIYNIYTGKSATLVRVSFLVGVLLSGIFFIGDSLWIPVLLMIALTVYLFMTKKLPIRILNLVATSILVIFVGYSSYALLLIRSSAHTPMNQNAPDNVFSLASYLNREQYGQRPLVYGETLNSMPAYTAIPKFDMKTGETDYSTEAVYDTEGWTYTKEVKTDPAAPDRYKYIEDPSAKKVHMVDELNMLFPRIYSSGHGKSYAGWLGKSSQEEIGEPVSVVPYFDQNGNPMTGFGTISLKKPTMAENLRFFFVYQLNHMYWRYFMWNFAGRQNDIQGQGEPTQGNWISGLPFIDNPRLGDQSLLPDELGKDNPGHNVFYMLPLLLGLIGLIWQASTSKRGTEQFWVIFFLFFMTGIAIVLYLNQTPDQPRERDYAFAGSFYAYAIWVGMGVAGIWRAIVMLTRPKELRGKGSVEKPENQADYQPAAGSKELRTSLVAAAVAALIGLIVPLQVVSQTWDDHDRSGRYTARDFGMNYLNSLDPNAIIFTYGDNDTFPLWYAQEVEGVRTDVKVVNLSYLATDWYINQLRRQSYDAQPVPLIAPDGVYAYNDLQVAIAQPGGLMKATDALRTMYKGENRISGYHVMPSTSLVIDAKLGDALKNGRITEKDIQYCDSMILVNFEGRKSLYLNDLMALDMLASSAESGWTRPIYYAVTVPSNYYSQLGNNLRQTGLAYEVTPRYINDENLTMNTDKAYRNTIEHFRWGGLDKITKPGQVYLDETVRRMVITNRGFLVNLATELAFEGLGAMAELEADSTANPARTKELKAYIAQRKKMSDDIMKLHAEKMPEVAMTYDIREVGPLIEYYQAMFNLTGDESYRTSALKFIEKNIDRFSQHVVYQNSLSPRVRSLLSTDDRYARLFFGQLATYYYPLFGGDINALANRLLKEKNIDIREFISQPEAE